MTSADHSVIPFRHQNATAVDDEVERFRDKLPREDVLHREHAELLAELRQCAEAYVRAGGDSKSAEELRRAQWRLQCVGRTITTAAREVVRARHAREQSRAYRAWRDSEKGGA